ncbi:hypothetical protein M9Y10_017347 [Tritrichomonas musculus]|uniref:Uncharacterized protein n=1 Tax=Tritrichomonas musculus TaxID=1915356 RepID=A0ABR2HTR3_9EUKA
MMSQKSKKYDKYVFIDLAKIEKSFISTTKLDRTRMYYSLKPFINNLTMHNIKKLENLAQILKDNGLNAQLMFEFMCFLEEFFDKRDIINRREKKKANQAEKNIFLNSLCLDYPEKMLEATVNFVVNHGTVTDKNSLYRLIRDKIISICNQAESQCNLNNDHSQEDFVPNPEIIESICNKQEDDLCISEQINDKNSVDDMLKSPIDQNWSIEEKNIDKNSKIEVEQINKLDMSQIGNWGNEDDYFIDEESNASSFYF